MTPLSTTAPTGNGSLVPLLIVVAIAATGLLTVLLVQLTDPQRRRRAEDRRRLIGDGWRTRTVVRQLPPDLAEPENSAGDEPAHSTNASSQVPVDSRVTGWIRAARVRLRPAARRLRR